MILLSKTLAFLRRLFARLVWFAAAPRNRDPGAEKSSSDQALDELGNFEAMRKEPY
jgi:hypothetical protein